MAYGWRLLFIPLWALCIAGAVVVAALVIGFMTWITFVVAGIVGLAIGIPAGIWNARKIRRDDPDWQRDRHIPA